MATFAYKVKDSEGRLVEGTQEAPSPEQLAYLLSQKGYFVLDISEKKTGILQQKLSLELTFLKKIKPRDLIVFTRQLATMLRAGVAFVDALSVIAEQTENENLRRAIHQITKDVKEGMFFSKAIAKFPHIFKQFYISLVEVGEAGGAMEEILNRLVEIMEKEEDTRSKIKAAFTYPVIIIFIVIAVVGFLTTFVFPKFIAIFKASGINLPLPTQILFNISNITRNYWYVIIGLLVGFILALRQYRKTSQGRYVTDRIILELPLIGNLVKKLVLGRFTRTLSTLYTSGVPILTSLEIVEKSITNVVLSRVIRKVKEGVREGKSLAKPMSMHKEFPPMMVQMITVGEETGAIADMLNEISRSYEVEVDYAIKNLTTAIEPLLIVFMGVIVGLTALSLFLPMFDMMKLVR